MSAMLIEIKSRMLLPKPVEIESEDDPRAELVRRLMEYEAIKLAAQRLDAMPQVGVDISVAAAYSQHISEIKYTPGCHYVKPIGNIKYQMRTYNLFHYKFISFDFL